MKLHLPSALRKALLLALAAVSATLGIQSATASLIFDGVGIQTYADFGQNCGRYVAGEVNDMLQAIRDKEGGIVIRYVGGAWKDETYTISQEQGMIDFSSASTNPVDTAVGYGFLATVAHNGVLSPTYSGLEVGDQNAIRYNSIDFRRGAPFHMESNTDYKMARLNKLVTDVQPSEFYSGENPSELNGEYLYRTGSGAVDLGWVDENGNWSGTQSMDLPYSFATGGIVTIEWAEGTHKDATDGNFGIFHHFNNNIYTEITGRDFRTKELIDTPNPLPYRVRSGDSGSPTWVYNEEAGAYQYISSGQSGATYFSQDRGDLKWSEYTKTRFNVTANLGSGDHTVTINPVTRTGETVSGEGEGVEVSTTLHYGSMQFTDASGTLQTKEFVGIEKGKHTWLNLSPVKDQVNWFHYGDEYFNVSKYSTEGKEFCFADMFETNTLAFEAGDGDVYDIQLQDNVDLGVGFVLLSKGENYTGPANFSLKSDNYVLDSAGFAIDEGVTLELDMANPDNRMTEWRKAGAGNLVLTGTRDTNALLNVGGSGTVTLAHTNDSYAAYNVLASSGSTLVVKDLKQVYRDVTLGAGGATLDLNGNNFTWNNSATPDGSGFKSLHLLVEKDVVTNRASQAIQITIQNPGEEAFVGAFKDTTEGAINVVYEGDAEKTWVMNTVFTDLQNNAASSFTVQQGSVALQGINTVHARQLLGRRDVNYFDWHYADAKMDVVVKEGAEFTLGSHARLKGDVTVEDGGVFTMKECTTHQYEYMEGGVIMDDTYAYREYIGLHGDINLVGEDSTFNVQFTPQNYYEDTDSESVYEGRITGSGGMLVDTAGGSLKLTNDQNDFTGFKELMRGTLVATSKAALGDTANGWGWTIYEAGVLQVTGSGLDELLPGIDGSSNGVLALTQNETGGTPDLSEHQDLIIGAVGDIQFGVKGTQEELDTNDNGEWHLGGGGGNLYVNYVLNDADGVLVLGNQYTTGRVILTNSGNHFSSIELKGGVTLSYETAEALGGATLSLNYGNRILGDKLLIKQLTPESNGVVLIDNLSDETIDLSTHGDLSLAADKKTTFTGSINLGENDTYRFGGGAGHLILDTDLTDGPGGAKRNILVDAQFFTPAYSDDGDFSSAGVVELTRVSQATGTVTVQGYDAAQNPDPDDPLYIWNHFSTATLQLSVDNALAHAESILLKDGGFIDINGTKQTFHSLINDYEEAILDTYGIIDYSEEQSGELVLNVEDESLWSPLFCNLAVPTLTKTGEGALEMVSVNESSLFTINDGTVYVYDELALNSRGVTRVEESGVLDVSDLGEALKNKTIELNNGGTMRVGSNAISGSISVNGGTGTLDANGGTANLDATIGAAQDATLVLNNGSFNLKAAQNNTEGGTINLQGGALSLNNANGVSIGGTLKVSGNATLNTTVNGVTHQLDRLNVENGANLSISGNNRSSVWSIHALDGSGNVTWQPGNNADARLVLLGEGSFSGTLTVAGRTNPQSAPGLVLADDLAVQHATISLQDNASVALSTANTHIAGLTGNASSAVYAYESAASTTLTITGSGTYTHSGTIGTSSAPMNIVMEGTGSQTFSGTVNAVDVSALKGTLSLQGNNILIAGDVTVARGATLSVEKNLVLNSGQILRTAGVTGNAGVVNGTVTFNGGGLSFDAAGLNGQTAALKFNGGSHTDNLDVNFTNTSYLKSNTTLTLTEGYGWNAGKLNATGLDYLTATFTTDGSLLKVSFTEKSGNRIWDGTNQQNTWSSSAFGQGSKLSSMDTAVFNDSAENTDVQVSGNVTSQALLFDNSKEYTVNTTGGATLSAGQVDLKGSGDVTLGAGVSITQTAEIAEGSTLVLQDTDTLGAGAKVNGAGKIALDSEAPASLDGNLTHIGCVEVRSGTLSVGQTLNADDMVVSSDADLHATTGSILANNATVHSSGTLEVTIGSGNANLDNAVAAGVDGTAGTFVKEGAGTLSVSKSLVADTVRVNDGSLKTSNKAIVPGFLETTKLLEVNSGATAYIGGDAYTIPDRAVTTVMVVDGGRLELAIAQNTTRTVAGNLTVKNGGTLKKVDGGLRFTGTTTLGSSSQDQVTLAGNWGKSGTIFDGLVKGEGKVTLAKGNSVEKFTFNNGDNTFSGEIEANAGTQLVAGHQTALATASNINLNGGSLVLAANEVDVKKLSGNGVLDVNATAELSSATLNVEEGNFSGTVGGNISITKSGSGTFALTGASSQFNGDLYVKEGAMSLGGSALGILGSTSSVTVKSGAAFQLDGDANVVGPMDIQGTLSLGGDISSRDSVQLAATSSLVGGSHTLKANSLVIEGVGGTNVQGAASQTLSASSSLTMFGDPSKSVTLQADAEAMIYVVNNVQDATLAGDSLTINLSGLGQTPEPGQWMGITLGGDLHTSSIGTGLLVECIIGEGQKMQGYYLSSSGDSANRVFFRMEGVVSQDLIWDHSSNTNWSSTDTNWHTAEAQDVHVAFTENANVTFENETCTANLTENISAGTVTLNNGANVTINGAGHNLSTGEIAAGEATLTIANSAVDKTTTVDGNAEIGTLNVKGGTTVFSGGAADLGKITMQRDNGATTLQFSAKAGTANEYSFDTLDMAPASGTAVDWLIIDEGVTVHGTGNTLAAGSTIHSAWGVHGGGLEVNGTLTTDSSIGLEANNNTAYIKGSGTINTAGLNLCNGSHTYIQDGITINITSDKGIFARNNNAGAASIHLKDATLQATTSDWEFKIGRAADSVTLEDASTGTTFEPAANRTITVSKALGGSGKLVKAGAGTLTLNAANTYSGGTMVNAGTLAASNTTALGSGAVTLNAGTLDLTTAVNTGAFTMNGGTLALDGENWLQSSGVIALNAGTLDLTGMVIASGQDYTLATGTSVALNSAVTLTLAQGLQDHYKLTANGTSLMLTFIQPAPSGALIWDGTANSHWSNSTEDRNWHMGSGQAGSSSFTEGADVHFASGPATVTLTDDITAGDATFAAGAVVAINNASEYEQQFSNVTIEEGASVSFDENCSTTITDTLALNGTVTNSGYLEIAAGTVAAGATGVLAGDGMTYLSGEITNAGTVKLDHAMLAGDPGAAITGDVVINGGVLLGSMTLGSEGSTVSVTEAFTISADAEYTVLGDVKLDDLSGAEFYYAEGEQDEYNNGFYIGMEVTVFSTEYETYAETPIDFQGSVTYRGMEGSMMFGVFSAYNEDYTTFCVNTVTDVAERYSHAREAGGDQFTTLALADSTSFNMDSQGAVLEHVIVEDGAEASVNIASTSTIGDVQVGDGLTLTGENGSLQLTTIQGEGALTVDGPAVTITGNNASYTGDIVVSGGTLKAGNNYALGSMDPKEHSIKVLGGGTLDVNGLQGTGDGYTVELAGGTLTNSGGVLGYGMRQLITHVSLTEDSQVNAANEFGITGSNYAKTSVDLGAYTLEKKGEDTFHIQNATVTGSGKIKVSEGTLAMSTSPSAGAGTYAANFEMAGGNVTGKVALGGNIEVETTADSSFNATMNLNGKTVTFSGNANLSDGGIISGAGAVTKEGTGEVTLGAANTYTGGTVIDAGTVVANNNTALGSGAVSVGTGGTLRLADNLTLSGGMVNNGTISMANKNLTLNGQAGGTTYNMGTITGNDSTNLFVNANANAVFTGDATMHHLQSADGSTVAVAKTATLTLTNTADRTKDGNYNTFYGLDNQGTISIKGTKGDLRFYGTEDDQEFNVGHLHIDGTSGTSYMLASGSVNHTTDITVKSLSGGGAGHTLQVTTCYNGNGTGQVVDLILGEDQDQAHLYEGKLQYGIGTSSAKAGSGMNVVIKDELVASQAELQTTFSSGTSATITVDTDRAKVKGLTDASTGKIVNVSGTKAAGSSDNRVLETVGDGNYTYNGKLGANLDVVHSGSGTQSFGGVDGFDGSVDVEAGVLNIMNAASVNVQDVIIGTNATLGVYKGAEAPDIPATENEGTLTIKDTKTLTAKGAGAKLNANLVMEEGSILDVHGTERTGLTLGSTLTLNHGMHLSASDLANVMGLMGGESYTLFNGVDSLTLGQTYTEAITPEMQIDAADWFHGVEAKRYYMVYDGSNVGSVAIFSATPEPTTSTLSLLALAALAARRRRK